MQVYWLFGNWIVSDIQRQRKEVAEADVKFRAYRKEQAAQAATAKPAPAKAAEVQDNPELEGLRNQVRYNQLQLDASYRMLKEWAKYWEDTTGVEQVCRQTAAVEAAEQKAAADAKTVRRDARRGVPRRLQHRASLHGDGPDHQRLHQQGGVKRIQSSGSPT